MLLENKVAIVTGAASARGIGKATARLFAEHGARVVIVDLDAGAAANAAADIGPTHVGVGGDVTDKAACERATREVVGCLYLASDLSAYVTGATLDVNGGMHIH